MQCRTGTGIHNCAFSADETLDEPDETLAMEIEAGESRSNEPVEEVRARILTLAARARDAASSSPRCHSALRRGPSRTALLVIVENTTAVIFERMRALTLDCANVTAMVPSAKMAELRAGRAGWGKREKKKKKTEGERSITKRKKNEEKTQRKSTEKGRCNK